MDLEKYRGDLPIEVFEKHKALALQVQAMRGYGYNRPEHAIMALGMGHQMGLSDAQVLTYLRPLTIKGQTTIELTPAGALALARRSGELIDSKVTYDETPYYSKAADKSFPISGCTVWVKRRGGEEHEETFTLSDAEQAELLRPSSNWTRWPKRMMYARALGFAMDHMFLDVIGFKHMWQEDVIEYEEAPSQWEGEYVEIDASD